MSNPKPPKPSILKPKNPFFQADFELALEVFLTVGVEKGIEAMEELQLNWNDLLEYTARSHPAESLKFFVRPDVFPMTQAPLNTMILSSVFVGNHVILDKVLPLIPTSYLNELANLMMEGLSQIQVEMNGPIIQNGVGWDLLGEKVNLETQQKLLDFLGQEKLPRTQRAFLEHSLAHTQVLTKTPRI